MTSTHRTSALLLLCLVTALAAPASAGPPSLDPPDHSSRVIAQVARLERARALVRDGSLVGSLRAASPSLPMPAVLPPTASLDAAVARLSTAVRAAELAVRAAVRPTPPRGAELFDAFHEARTRLTTDPHDAPALRDLRRFRADVGRDVDIDAIRLAGLRLAAEIDAAMPALRAARNTAPRQAAPCDIAGDPGDVCVASDIAHEHVIDTALLIDLGGDDIHRHGAGGGGALAGGPHAVSVTIDLAGDDVYDSASPTVGGTTVSQGAGLGGIGILVDDGGSDRYRVRSVRDDQGVFAQGYSFAGVGLLHDAAGDDVYTARNEIQLDASVIDVWGVGSAGGSAALVDAGGDDRYDALAIGVPHGNADVGMRPGDVTVYSGGVGVIGEGLFADAAGTDELRIEGVAVAAEFDPVNPPPLPTSTVSSFAFASAAGAATVLTGPGSSSYLVRSAVRGDRVGSVRADGIGTGLLGGAAGLSDAGGDDSYVLEAEQAATASRAVTATCACANGEVTALAEGSAVANGPAHGERGAVAVLIDDEGADSYSTIATSSASSEIVDERPPDATPKPSAIAITAPAMAHGSGSGVDGGAGRLLDASGNDRYLLLASSSAASGGGGAWDQAEARDATALGLGATQSGTTTETGGEGVIEDTGGADTYTTTVASASTVDGEAGARGTLANRSAGVAGGSGIGRFVDRDGGLTDTFTWSVPYPACTGTRGSGAWIDCGAGVGVGLMD